MPTQDPVIAGFEAGYGVQQTRAQTRLFQAQAQEKESEAADQRLLQTIASGQALARQKASQGQTATLEDLGQYGMPKSQAEPLEELLAAAHEKGMSPAKTIPLSVKIAEIRKNEAAAINSQAEAQTRHLDAQLKGAELLSGFAAAALENPEQYDQMRLQAARQGLPVQQLPPTFNATAMQALQTQGVKVIDRLKLQQKKLKDDSSIALDKAQQADAEQRVRTGKAREELLRERRDQLHKDGGKNTKPMTEAQRVLMEQRKANMAAKSIKENPLPPADVNDPLYQVGQTFTIKGKIYEMVGRDARGIPQVVPRTVAALPTTGALPEDTSGEEDLTDEEMNLGD